VEYIVAASALIWICILIAPWRPWSVRERLESEEITVSDTLGDLTVLIPARNEAECVQRAVTSAIRQGPGVSVLVIDDQSDDDTAAMARSAGQGRAAVIAGSPLPSGWTGKLWALEQGRLHAQTKFLLLLDADIELNPGIISTMRRKMKREKLHFISLMVELRMKSFWEKLLMPAFIFFFKLLYPFRISNSGSRLVSAAAGGCILLETRVLSEIGGFAAIKDALIDDCALAKKVKEKGFRAWIGLTRSARSLRAYDELGTIWKMVERTAFTQLHYSVSLLVFLTAIMLTAFWAPLAHLALTPMSKGSVVALIAIGAMVASYLPTLIYYGMTGWWSLLLPFIGALYLAMTWTSAIRYAQGRRSEWKGRAYHRAGQPRSPTTPHGRSGGRVEEESVRRHNNHVI